MKVKTYDNFDDLINEMEKNRAAADAAVQPWQEEAGPGNFYVRWVPEMQTLVYGELLDPLEWYNKQPQPLDPETLAEKEYEEQLWQASHMKHNRHGKHYSVLCPEGEYGTVHVCTFMVMLNQEQFEFMRRCEWPQNIAELRRNLQLFQEMN